MSAINRDLPSRRRRTEQGEWRWQRSEKSKMGGVQYAASGLNTRFWILKIDTVDGGMCFWKQEGQKY